MTLKSEKQSFGVQGHSYRRTPILDFYPEIDPFASGFLTLDHGHEMYWEQTGNPEGIPVVVLHGGPGGGTSPLQRRFFDPEHYRIILFDQRGAGRSTPTGQIEYNTRALLVSDMEKLRRHLRIEKWHLFGGSWGSTLALSYAAEHPGHCRAMTLSGLFLMEKDEIDWFFYGIRSFYPEAWEQFSAFIPEDEQDDLLNAYHRRLFGKDEKVAIEAAVCWCLYESACASLIPNYEIITTEDQKRAALTIAQIECHYFKNELIDPKNSLMNSIDRFRAVPTTLIQGRYDMLCPLRTAYKLHQAWPEADYIVVSDGGHSEQDPAIRSRLIETMENAKTL